MISVDFSRVFVPANYEEEEEEEASTKKITVVHEMSVNKGKP